MLPKPFLFIASMKYLAGDVVWRLETTRETLIPVTLAFELPLDALKSLRATVYSYFWCLWHCCVNQWTVPQLGLKLPATELPIRGSQSPIHAQFPTLNSYTCVTFAHHCSIFGCDEVIATVAKGSASLYQKYTYDDVLVHMTLQGAYFQFKI